MIWGYFWFWANTNKATMNIFELVFCYTCAKSNRYGKKWTNWTMLKLRTSLCQEALLRERKGKAQGICKYITHKGLIQNKYSTHRSMRKKDNILGK